MARATCHRWPAAIAHDCLSERADGGLAKAATSTSCPNQPPSPTSGWVNSIFPVVSRSAWAHSQAVPPAVLPHCRGNGDQLNVDVAPTARAAAPNLADKEVAKP